MLVPSIAVEAAYNSVAFSPGEHEVSKFSQLSDDRTGHRESSLITCKCFSKGLYLFWWHSLQMICLLRTALFDIASFIKAESGFRLLLGPYKPNLK